MEATHPTTPRVIVSMTSFPAAIGYAEKAVRSLLQSSVMPDKLVLYLTFAQFGGEQGIPSALKALARESDVFEIRDYGRDIRSYRKLIPALADFPDDIIVTVDDDVHYHRHMLRDLLKLHKELPHAVIAHRAKTIRPGKGYKKWRKFRWYHFLTKRLHVAFSTLQTGVGGVLYPPHALKKEMLDVDLFTSLAPTTDDIWFWAAAVANGYPVVPVPFGRNKPRSVGKPRELSLKTTNFKKGSNRNADAMEAVLRQFPDVRQRLELECK